MKTQHIYSHSKLLLEVPHRPSSIELYKDLSFEEFCLTLSPLLSSKHFSKCLLESPKKAPVDLTVGGIKSKTVVELDAKSGEHCPSVSITLSDTELSLPLKRPTQRFIFGGESKKARNS